MGYRRLSDIRLRHNVVHADPFAAAEPHDLLSGLVPERLGKIHRGCFRHIDQYLYDHYIDIGLFVKSSPRQHGRTLFLPPETV